MSINIYGLRLKCKYQAQGQLEKSLPIKKKLPSSPLKTVWAGIIPSSTLCLRVPVNASK